MSQSGPHDGGLYNSGSQTMESDVQPLTEQSHEPYKSPLDNYTPVSAPSISPPPMKSTFAMGVSLAAKFALSFPTSSRRSNSPTQSSYPAEELSEKEEQENLRRAPSPAPTEILDPEPENILITLQSLNIKVRDFAYPTTPTTHHRPPPPPVTEIFDQNKAIAEFEFRLAQSPRTYPISGKTLRKLLDLGWVSMEEAKTRLHQMDWESMKEYDARDSRYPWRPVRWFPPSPGGSGRSSPRNDDGSQTTGSSSIGGGGGPPPDAQARENFLLAYGAIFVHMDRVRRLMEAQIQRDEDERKLIEAAEERMRILEAEREGGMGMVVGPEDDDDDDDGDDLKEDGEGFVHVPPSTVPTTPCTGKKRSIDDTSPTSSVIMRNNNNHNHNNGRGSPTPSSRLAPRGRGSPVKTQTSGSKRARLSANNPLPPLPGHPVPPPKQYPAPLSSYDPAVYPEAEAVIKAADAARRPLPVIPLPPIPSYRANAAADMGSFSAPSPAGPSASSASSSSRHKPLPPPAAVTPGSLGRTDTPPLDEDDDGFYDENDEDDCPSLQKKRKEKKSKGNHNNNANNNGNNGGGTTPGPSGLKRTLSRTQTFSQL